MTHTLIQSTAAAALIAVAAGTTPVIAQSSGDSASGAQSGQSSSQSASGNSSGTSSGQSTSGQSSSDDSVVASVGGTDITGQDVADFIETLPPQMQQQPPQMLASMALEQVILRELLLQEAQAQNLADDPRVSEIADRNAQIAQEDAMVAVFLQDRLAERVSDEEVQQAYEQLQSQAGEGQSLPPLDAVRPQLEQRLQQQELPALREELAQDVEIVVYETGGSSSSSNDSGSASDSSGSQESSSQSE